MRVHHIAISVKNGEKSANFYKQNFGFIEINRYTKSDRDGGAIVLMLDNIQLEIFQFDNYIEKQDDLSNLKAIGLKHIGIQVVDVRHEYERLKANNIDIDEPKKGTTCAQYCFLRDPDGIPIELYQSL